MTMEDISLMQGSNQHVNAVKTPRYVLFFSYETPIVLVDTARERVHVNRDMLLSKTTQRHIKSLVQELRETYDNARPYVSTAAFRNKLRGARL